MPGPKGYINTRQRSANFKKLLDFPALELKKSVHQGKPVKITFIISFYVLNFMPETS